jgi:hypothetical protein
MQVVQTSFNPISLNASCSFLIHMSFLELHNVDAPPPFFFSGDLFQATQAMQAAYLLALPTKKARILCLD